MKRFWISVSAFSLFLWLFSFALANECTDSYWVNAHISWGECVCKDWYVLNDSKTQCVKPTKSQWDEICWWKYWYHSTAYENDYSLCTCKDWYTWNLDKTSCEKYTKETWNRDCKETFWYFAEVTDDDLTKCECKDWYEFNSSETRCIKKDADIKKSNTRDEELQEAIEWMYNNWLTIYNTPATFMSNDFLTREQASKFFAQFAAKVLNREFTDNVDLNKFSDIKKADQSLTYYIIQANHMWLFQWSEWKFMPFNNLTKAQAIAVTIRMIDWYLEESTGARYKNYYDTANIYWLLNRWEFNLDTLDSENITRWDMALLIYSLYKYINANGDRAGVSWYNDELVDLWLACADYDFEEEIENLTSKQLETATDNALNICSNSVRKIIDAGSWEWDDTLQRAILLDLGGKISLVKKLKELVPYQDIEELTSDQEKAYQEIVKELNIIIDENTESEEELTKTQVNFAKKHRYSIW